MICKFCGNVVDETASVCPYCGNSLGEDAFLEDNEDEEYESEPVQSVKKPIFGGQKRPASAPASGGSGIKGGLLSLASVVAAVLSLICVVMLLSVNSTIKSTNNALIQQVNILTSAVSSLESGLNDVTSAVSNVQNDAYNQLASQNISITKDLTSLTGPVTEGKYNTMFILRAKGSLNIDTSFDWQKYNTTTGGWVSIVFTGTATTNDEYGLRIENGYDRTTSEYSTTLWANGITSAAAGSYRCVVTDSTGVKKSSGEVTVQVG